MSAKPARQETEKPGSGSPTISDLFTIGRESTNAMLGMQEELLEACERASRAWLSRVNREANLWSQLASELMSISTAAKVSTDTQKETAQRMRMATEDGRKMADEVQKAMEAMVRSASPAGRPPK